MVDNNFLCRLGNRLTLYNEDFEVDKKILEKKLKDLKKRKNDYENITEEEAEREKQNLDKENEKIKYRKNENDAELEKFKDVNYFLEKNQEFSNINVEIRPINLSVLQLGSLYTLRRYLSVKNGGNLLNKGSKDAKLIASFL